MASSSTDFDIDTSSTSTGGNGKVAISRSLLFENSPVIKARLEHTDIGQKDEVILTGNTDCLLQLKRFLEEGRIEPTSLEHVYDIYKMARIYSVEKLLNFCKNYIRKQLNPSTFRTIHNFALNQDDKIIEYYCWKEFDEKCDEILQTEEFSRCEDDIIKVIVSRPKYRKLKEITLFEFLIDWAQKKYQLEENSKNADSEAKHEKLRQYLNPFLNKIRFLSMNNEELDEVFRHNILSGREKQYICTPKEDREMINTICDTETKRTEQCYRSLIVYENRNHPHVPLNRDASAFDEFHCSFCPKENCYLSEIILPITHYHKAGIQVVIKVETVGMLLLDAKYSCTMSGRVKLSSEPLFLRKNFQYLVSAIIDTRKVKYPIKIIKDAEFYIQNSEFESLMKDEQRIYQWNQFFIKIILYF